MNIKELLRKKSKLIIVLLGAILTFTFISGGYFIITKDLYESKSEKPNVQVQTTSDNSDLENVEKKSQVTVTPTSTPSATIIPTPTSQPINNTNNPTSTPIPTPTATPTISSSPSPTPTVGYTPSVTPSPSPTFGPTITPTPYPTFTGTPSPSPTFVAQADYAILIGGNTSANFNSIACGINLKVELTNYGTYDPAPNQDMVLKVQARHIESNTNLFEYYQPIWGIVPQSSLPLSYFSSSYGPGTYEVTYTIDSSYVIGESNEGNNTFTTTFFSYGACLI
jgi:hypothetical protein